MSYPMSDRMNAEGREIVQRLRKAQAEMEQASLEAAKSRVNFEITFANRILQAKAGDPKATVATVEAEATQNTGALKTEYRINEALADAATSNVRVVMAELNAWQSMCKNISIEAELTRHE